MRCRQRRVRCDEGRPPSCRRCMHRGEICEGYRNGSSSSSATTRLRPPVEEQAVDRFTCTQTSSPGFLEHLRSMFNEVNVDGWY